MLNTTANDANAAIANEAARNRKALVRNTPETSWRVVACRSVASPATWDAAPRSARGS